MAYSLYRSAAASPAGLRQGLVALQNAINFRDVRSDAGVKALQEVAINDFVAKSNMAKQALGELGAFNRDQLLVDYYKDRDDENRAAVKKAGKTSALLALLGGGGAGMPKLSFGGFGDVRDEAQRERNYRSAGDSFERSRMGGLHPDKAISGMQSMFGSSRKADLTVLPGQQNVTKEPDKLELAKTTSAKQFYDFLSKSLSGAK